MSITADFKRLNQALEPWPRANLAHLPTALDPLPRLSDHYPGHTLYLKRDDCTGLAMGGNKARLLEYYLGDALAQGCDVVLSTGATQSNYMRSVAASAAKLGMECHIQLESRVEGKSQDYHQSGNVLLDQLLGAHIHYYSKGEDEFGADREIRNLADSLAAQGKKPYVVPLAPVEKPKGALGYVLAAKELAEQFIQQDLAIDLIAVGSGSGLTHAGLVVGLRLLGLDIPVLGACVRRDAAAQHGRILAECRKISAMLGHEGLVEDKDIWVSDSAFAPGYGHASNQVVETMTMMAKSEGILLDPVYSAKTVGCTLQLIARGELADYDQILMIHTGGTPALFAYREELQAALSSGL